MNGEANGAEEKSRLFVYENQGMDMEVLSEENEYLFSGVIGKPTSSGKEVRIELRRGDEIPVSIQEKDRIKLVTDKRAGSNQIAVVNGTVTECGKTFIYMAPEGAEQYTEGRKHFRIWVKGECLVRRDGSQEDDLCHTADISLTGIRILSRQEYEPGEKITIRGLKLIENGKIHTFPAEIVRKAGEEKGGWNTYGCAFREMPVRAEDMLCHDIFALELDRRRKKGRPN